MIGNYTYAIYKILSFTDNVLNISQLMSMQWNAQCIAIIMIYGEMRYCHLSSQVRNERVCTAMDKKQSYHVVDKADDGSTVDKKKSINYYRLTVYSSLKFCISLTQGNKKICLNN